MPELLHHLPPEAWTGGGLALLILYAVWRRVRQDLSSDRRAEEQDSFRADLLRLNADLVERADHFARERNDALARASRAEAEVAVLRERLELLEAAAKVTASAVAVGGGE